MKKLNKKGVTLIELIVSFAIVSVALIYFYQTIVDLHRMYKNSNKATDEFVNKDYALRVLDAWATKSSGNLSTINDSNICTNYNMACYDSKTEYVNDGEFKKITLIDSSNNVLAVYYKYEKTLVDLKLESVGALDEYGNVNSYANMLNALKEADDDIVTVGFDKGIIKYKITDKNGTERYTKTNTNTIKEIIERDTKGKTKQEINNKVQELVGTSYMVKESVEKIKTGVYARVYNIVKADTNATVAKNIYEIENTQMEKLDEFNLNVSGDQSNRKYEDIIGKEMNINGETQHIENKGSYYLTFELSSNFDYDYCALFFSPKNETEYEFRWNKNEISNEYIDNVKDMGIIYKKQNDGTYVVSFLKLDVTDSNSYIKPYKWDESCKIKLVEAYKYNN